VGLSQRMRERLATCGITSLFPVQRATFEALMNGKDMLVKARTGSGKTIGFALPIIEKIMAAREEQRPRKGRAPASVVLAPTRELALQIQREFTRIEREVTAVCIYGGAPSFPQERELRGGVDVVVGTPGRVIDMIERGALRMNEVKVFVLDEADEMLKMGFQDDVDRIMEELPEERQMNLWSATQPRWITQMARKYCKNLETMDMVGNNPVRTADTIRHVAVAAYWEARGSTVANMVRAHAHGKRALVFCNTKMDVESVAAMPELVGMARVIHGDVNQQQRERTLADFRAGRFTVLVATDVAARGIDVPEVALVVQTKVAPAPISFPAACTCPCLCV
jgi:ATP-dependent RNA helicase DDX21